MLGNRNQIPGDVQTQFYTSGVRVGTPAVTTRGMGPEEMQKLAKIMATTIRQIAAKKEGNPDLQNERKADVRIRLAVTAFTEEFAAEIAGMAQTFPIHLSYT